MDLDEAIQAHASWKVKLSIYLKKPDASLQAAEIAPDNRCKLGQWLYAEGRKFSLFPEYKTLVTEHARFHRAAAKVVEKANAGQEIKEEVALGSNSEFAAASRNVINAITALKNKVAPVRAKS